MDTLRFTDLNINRQRRFCSFFSTLARCQQDKNAASKYSCSFQVSDQTQPIGQFDFDYTIAADGRVTLMTMRINKYDKGNPFKILTYIFATNSFIIHRFKKLSEAKLYPKSLKKLIDWFCNEYELNAHRKTELSLFAKI